MWLVSRSGIAADEHGNGPHRSWRHAPVELGGAAVTWGGVAAADVLISPPLVAEGARVLDCYLVNVGEVPRFVKIQVFNRAGVVVKTVQTTLQPGEEDVARTESALAGRWCKFTVPGPKTDYRASALVRQVGVGAISALPAS